MMAKLGNLWWRFYRSDDFGPFNGVPACRIVLLTAACFGALL